MVWVAATGRLERMSALALLTGLTVVIASGCGATKMAASTGGHGASSTRSGGAIAARAAGIDPVLVNSFAILRRPVRPEDQLLPTFLISRARRLPHPGLSTTRLRGIGRLPALARAAAIPGTKLEEWLEPGRHGYCVWTAERTTSGTFVTGASGLSAGPRPRSQPGCRQRRRRRIARSGSDDRTRRSRRPHSRKRDRPRSREFDRARRAQWADNPAKDCRGVLRHAVLSGRPTLRGDRRTALSNQRPVGTSRPRCSRF